MINPLSGSQSLTARIDINAGATGTEGTKMDDVLNLLQEALGGVRTGRTVITAGSKEELLEKVKAAMNATEEDAEDDRLVDMARGLDAEQAAVFAGAALLAAGREFVEGHYQHSQLKIEASDSWTALADLLLRIEQRKDLQERQRRDDEAWQALREDTQREEAEAASSGSGE